MRKASEREEAEKKMTQARLILMAVIIGTAVAFGAVGAVAQRGGNDNRPKKEDQKIKEQDKKEKPPPSNSNRKRP